MRNTAEQHRSSIGSFAARIASSGWTKSSAGPKSAAFLLSDLVQKILLEGECSKIRQKLLWTVFSICLDAVLICLAAPTILQIIDGGMIIRKKCAALTICRCQVCSLYVQKMCSFLMCCN